MKRKLLCLGMILSVVVLVSGYGIKKYFSHRSKKEPYLTVVGMVKMADGLGRLSVELLEGMKDHVAVNFIPTRNKHALDYTDVPKEIKKIIKKSSSIFGKVVIFSDFLCSSYIEPWKIFEAPPEPNQIRIAYSMFESSRIPQEWTIILNHFFDAVAVPDKYLIEVYANSGVTIPIFEVPLGLDLSRYLKEPLKMKRNSPMVFGNLGSCTDRKNLISLVQAFDKAFGNRLDVQLMINCRYGDKVVKDQLKEEIRKLNLSNVSFSEICLTEQAYLSLFKTIDCFVTLSKGEGFSIQPREAMAMGIPVIATENSAQKTVCESQLVKTVSSPIEEPAVYWENEVYGNFSLCQVEEAALALKEMYENYETYLEKAQEARNWTKKFEFKNLRPLYLSLVRPKEVVLGEENKITAEFLMTNSPKLYEKYRNLNQ